MNLNDIEKRLRARTETKADINYIYDTLRELNELKKLHEAYTELGRIEKAYERKDKYKGNEVLTDVKSVLRTAYSSCTGFYGGIDFEKWIEEAIIVDVHGLELKDFLQPKAFTKKWLEYVDNIKGFMETLNELAKAINHRKVFEVQQEYNKRKKLIGN